MTASDPTAFTSQLRNLRQTRRFSDRAVPDDVLNELLEVARWSGSSKNTQPWHFIVVTNSELRKQIAEAGPFAGFLESAPVVIVLVMAGSNPRSEPYDEGRVSERLMLAADGPSMIRFRNRPTPGPSLGRRFGGPRPATFPCSA